MSEDGKIGARFGNKPFGQFPPEPRPPDDYRGVADGDRDRRTIGVVCVACQLDKHDDCADIHRVEAAVVYDALALPVFCACAVSGHPKDSAGHP